MAPLKQLVVPLLTIGFAVLAFVIETLLVKGLCLPIHQGTASLFIEMSAELSAVYILLRFRNEGEQKASRLLLCGGFLAVCIADFFYWLFNYHFNGSNGADQCEKAVERYKQYDPLLVLTTPCMYCVAFTLLAVALIAAWERPLRPHFRNLASLVVGVGSMALLVFAIGMTMYSSDLRVTEAGKTLNEFWFYRSAQALAVLTGGGLLAVSGITFLSASSPFWTFFSASAGTLVLSDWSMRVEQFLKDYTNTHMVDAANRAPPTPFGYYEIFWLGSIVAMSITCHYYKDRGERPQSFDSTRLVATVKFAVMVALAGPVAAPVIADLLIEHGPIYKRPVRLALVGCALSIFTASAISNYLAAQFAKFATRLDDPNTDPNEFFGEFRGFLKEFFAARKARIAEAQRREAAERIAMEAERVAMEAELATKEAELAAKEAELAATEAERAAKEAERISTEKRRLAHDIKAPVSVLRALVSTPGAEDLLMSNMPAARSAVERISDMANEMLRETTRIVGTETEVIATLLEMIVSQKRIEYRHLPGVSIEDPGSECPDACAVVNAPLFYRVFSNLITNAVESVGANGTVRVELEQRDQHVCIKVHDNGSGIAPEQLEAIRTGLTTKTHGHGLGLSTAITILSKWQGSLEISSKGLGEGATVTVILPKAPAPAWFTSKLEVPREAKVLIVDDEVAVRQTWAALLRNADAAPSEPMIHEAGAAPEIERWYNDKKNRPALLLVDYELGDGANGVETVIKLGATQHAIVVTSHFQNSELRKLCAKNQLRMIPKTSLGRIPVIWT
jgi:signal transduction histidine kinase